MHSIGTQIENTYKDIIRLALPTAIAIFIPQLIYFTNTYFLGNYTPVAYNYDTQDVLAANGIASIYYLTLSMIGYGFSAGALMIMSRYAGRNEHSNIGNIFGNAFNIAFWGSLFLILFSLIFSPWLFSHTIQNKPVKDIAVSFIYIRLFGLPFIYFSQLCNSFFIATQNAKKIIISSSIQCITHITLDYYLIYGNSIFPEMGLQGTAIASVCSEIIYAFSSFVLIKNNQFKQFAIVLFKKITNIQYKEILKYASPLILMYMLSIGTWEYFFILVEKLGKDASASSQILRSVFGIVGIAAWAMGSTSNTMVSNLIGQKKQQEVISLIIKIVSLSFGFALIVGIAMLVFAKPFLQFITHDTAIIEISLQPLQVVVFATWMLSISTVYFNAVIGTGFTKLNMYFEIAAIIFYILYCYIFIYKYKCSLTVAWMSEFVYWSILLVLSTIFIYSKKWQKSKTVI